MHACHPGRGDITQSIVERGNASRAALGEAQGQEWGRGWGRGQSRRRDREREGGNEGVGRERECD